MNDQLKMFDQTTLEDSRSVISSPELESGPILSGSPDGPMTEKSGQDHVPVSRSVSLASKKDSKTSDIFGPPGPHSSPSENLQLSLVNRLRIRSDILGSTLFGLIWKKQATPSGRSFFLQRASVRRTDDTESSSWPTPCSQDGPNVGPSQGIDLLPGAVRQANWPTPSASNGTGTRGQGGENLQTASTWCSPSARDWKDSPGQKETGTNPDGSERKRMDQLGRQVRV